MEFLLNRFRNLTVLLLVILAQLVLLAYQVKSNEDVRLIRVWSVTAVTPIAKVLEVVRANTIGLVENYFVLINVREQNRQLSDELGKLKIENQFLKTELQTADRARALQAFQSRTPSRTLPARIIGTGTGANSRVVFVDQGSGAGVMKGMAVVTPDGIVGKVLAAYPTAAQVMLITDPSFAAGVISDKNRVHGTVKGLGQSKVLVNYVQNEEKVEVGETFFTSGDDRVFPKGMPVGKVNIVRDGSNFKEIYLVPSGFQHGLEEVLIVIEGVHQPILETQAKAAPDVYIMPPPRTSGAGAKPGSQPPEGAEATGSAAVAGTSSAQMTDADRLRERYKKIGEAQRHVFGTGAPGSRPPDFNIDPNAPKPLPTTPGQSGTATPPSGSLSEAPAQPPAAAKPRPAMPGTPVPGSPSQTPAGGAQNVTPDSTAPATRPAPSQNAAPAKPPPQKPAPQKPKLQQVPPATEEPGSNPQAPPVKADPPPPVESPDVR